MAKGRPRPDAPARAVRCGVWRPGEQEKRPGVPPVLPKLPSIPEPCWTWTAGPPCTPPAALHPTGAERVRRWPLLLWV